MAVDTLGPLLVLPATPANVQERTQVEDLARQVQAVTGETVELAFVDQGYTGDAPAAAAAAHGIRLEVVKLSEAKHSFVLLPRRWVVERSFAWKSRFRRLVRDYERLTTSLEGLQDVAFACLELKRTAPLLSEVHNCPEGARHSAPVRAVAFALSGMVRDGRLYHRSRGSLH